MKTKQEIEEFRSSGTFLSDEEIEMAGRRFEHRLRRIQRRRRIVWAAGAAAAAVMIGWIITPLWTERSPEVKPGQTVSLAQEPILVPTLILPGGDRIRLEEKIDNRIASLPVGTPDSLLAGRDTLQPDTAVLRYNTVVIPAGCTYDLILADGTAVKLNARSSLKYPEKFADSCRGVELTGEAYFQVAKSTAPFEVNTAGNKIRVYGTQFNVKTTSYNTIETVLVEGKIGFTPAGQKEIPVAPGQQLSYDPATGYTDLRQVDVACATAWVKGLFKYRDTALPFILKDFALWYGVEFEPKTDITNIELTLTLNRKTPLDEAISFMELLSGRKFTKEGGKYIIR